MKYIRTDGTVVDGTPEELAAYHKLMVGRQRPYCGPRKASFSEAENAMVRKMVAAGKSYKQIARKLWTLNLSPYPRTAPSVQMQVFRHLSK